MMNSWITDHASVEIAFVRFDGQPQMGKYRPVLVVKRDAQHTYFFRITSQYANKSPRIKHFYCPLKNWKKLGLRKPSFVDLHNYVKVDNNNDDFNNKLGNITTLAAQTLNNKLNQLYSFPALRKLFK